MKQQHLLSLDQHNEPIGPYCIRRLTNLVRLRRSLGAVIALCALLALPSITAAQQNYAASEFIEEDIQNGMSLADIVALLDQTVGGGTRAHPAIAHPLPQGLYVTPIARRSKPILLFELDLSDTKHQHTA